MLQRATLGEKPDDLNSTDEELFSLLPTGSETRGSITAQLDRHGNYVCKRLKCLRATGLVVYQHEETALYETLECGREWADIAGIETRGEGQ